MFSPAPNRQGKKLNGFVGCRGGEQLMTTRRLRCLAMTSTLKLRPLRHQQVEEGEIRSHAVAHDHNSASSTLYAVLPRTVSDAALGCGTGTRVVSGTHAGVLLITWHSNRARHYYWSKDYVMRQIARNVL